MPRYGDDQCEECGAARVSGSRLCVGCLVEEREILEEEVLIKMTVIEIQRKRIINLEATLKESIGYGFRRNQEVDLLLRSHKRLEDRLGEVTKDGKDR
jgi:hypothetical protein